MIRRPDRGELPDGMAQPHGFFGTGDPLPSRGIDPDVWLLVDDYVAAHPGGPGRLIPLLRLVQDRLGYLPFPVQEYVAHKLGMSPIQVYGVVSFYRFFTSVPRGRYHLRVCSGTGCHLRHAEFILDRMERLLGIRAGEVTADLLFSLEEVGCLGVCGRSPAVMVNNDLYGDMTGRKLRELVGMLKEQAGGSEGSGG